MKRPKTIIAAIIAAFLAFAPPGTLIALAALILALVSYCSGSDKKLERAPQTQPTTTPAPVRTPAAHD